MGVYLNVIRYKKDDSYIVNESLLYDLIEVDYDKIENYKVGDILSFRNGIQTINYLLNHPFKSDWGIYDNSAFFFYILAVSPDFGISYKKVDRKTIVALFKPDNILKIVTIIVENISSFSEAEASEIEIYNLKKLRAMLNEAKEENDYILLMWG